MACSQDFYFDAWVQRNSLIQEDDVVADMPRSLRGKRKTVCTALHCTALHCTALHCTALHCTALHCIPLLGLLLCRCVALREASDVPTSSECTCCCL
jgi:hypothetical protein